MGMLGVMSLVMVFIPPKDAPEKEKEPTVVREVIVPDDPQSERYKLGEIDWKKVKEMSDGN